MTLRHRLGDIRSDRILHAALHGFSGVGTLAVALLILSGAVNSLFLVGLDRISGLWTTLYGGLLLAKLGVFGLMLALAASNRFLLTPGLSDALDEPEGLKAAVARLKGSLVLETLLALALLGLVAIMGTLAPVSVGGRDGRRPLKKQAAPASLDNTLPPCARIFKDKAPTRGTTAVAWD
jgi:copper resistance protein D